MVSNRLLISMARLAVLGCLAAAACTPAPQHARPAPEVGVVIIQAQPVQLTTVLPGRTSPFATSDIRPQVNGILQARLFKEGDTVKAGQPLYQIDPALYRAAYDNTLAALATAKAKATRYDMLIKANAVAPQDNDDVQAAYKQALANVETAKINLDYTRITAPISGRIGRSAFTEGALVTADQTTALSTIQTLDPIYVDITQSSSELLNLKIAMQGGHLTRNGPADARVTLLLDNGTPYAQAGTLQFSEVTVDQNTGEVTLRAIFPNPDGVLLPGMFVRATIIEGVQQNAILAPQQGVSRNEKGDPVAYVVDANGTAQLRSLTTPRTIGDKWLVTSGLRSGDRLIVEGLQNVTPGAHVRAVPASFGTKT
jgi:membrane fusion protein, multidrug efflux system